ncbi:hypothetical protein L204_104527 [Cryptococcus depauperatus]|nr:hypothetical protein L204_03387 [Cryptococcus depauperatus CBS 7855]
MSNPVLQVYLLNAFSPDPHSGNQAAVVVFPTSAKPHPLSVDEQFMLGYAQDFNFSETAYLVPSKGNGDDGVGKFGLRWFTPGEEVLLCGHATLASSQAIFSTNPTFHTIEFSTRFAGTLIARKQDDHIEITLPCLPKPILDTFGGGVSEKTMNKVQNVFGIDRAQVSNVEVFYYGNRESIIIQFDSSVNLKHLSHSNESLLDLSSGMILITQINSEQSDEKLHISTRVFAPGLGVYEDPVCGSGNAKLTGYYLYSPLAKKVLPQKFAHDPLNTVIECDHLSKRGGKLILRWDDGNVKIVGKALEFMRGTLTLPPA